jgi:hypothetical protein
MLDQVPTDHCQATLSQSSVKDGQAIEVAWVACCLK